MSTPVPITATVMPPPFSAPRCAAASIPTASPLTMTTPAAASSLASSSATASPYGEAFLDPTIAARGPGGGGQRPRAWRVASSGGCIVEPVPERLQDVVLGDRVGPVKVGGGARNPPGPVEAPGRKSLLLGPAFQRP